MTELPIIQSALENMKDSYIEYVNTGFYTDKKFSDYESFITEVKNDYFQAKRDYENTTVDYTKFREEILERTRGTTKFLFEAAVDNALNDIINGKKYYEEFKEELTLRERAQKYYDRFQRLLYTLSDIEKNENDFVSFMNKKCVLLKNFQETLSKEEEKPKKNIIVNEQEKRRIEQEKKQKEKELQAQKEKQEAQRKMQEKYDRIDKALPAILSKYSRFKIERLYSQLSIIQKRYTPNSDTYQLIEYLKNKFGEYLTRL